MKTRIKVETLTKEGKSTAFIARELGITSASVSYHKKKLNLSDKERLATYHHKQVNWEVVQQDIDAGFNHFTICARNHCARATLTAAYKKGIVNRPKRTSEKSLIEYLEEWNGIKARPHFRKTVKKKMVNEGYCELKCSICELKEWRGKAAPLELDHIDGDPYNNDLSNLRILCLHCHTQTETFGWRNNKVKKSLGRI